MPHWVPSAAKDLDRSRLAREQETHSVGTCMLATDNRRADLLTTRMLRPVHHATELLAQSSTEYTAKGPRRRQWAASLEIGVQATSTPIGSSPPNSPQSTAAARYS